MGVCLKGYFKPGTERLLNEELPGQFLAEAEQIQAAIADLLEQQKLNKAEENAAREVGTANQLIGLRLFAGLIGALFCFISFPLGNGLVFLIGLLMLLFALFYFAPALGPGPTAKSEMKRLALIRSQMYKEESRLKENLYRLLEEGLRTRFNSAEACLTTVGSQY